MGFEPETKKLSKLLNAHSLCVTRNMVECLLGHTTVQNENDCPVQLKNPKQFGLVYSKVVSINTF